MEERNVMSEVSRAASNLTHTGNSAVNKCLKDWGFHPNQFRLA